MWSVWNTTRMKSDLAPFHAFTAHKVTFHVIQHFVRIYVAVLVRCRNRLRMIIVFPGAERAHHELITFDGLMNRRRLRSEERRVGKEGVSTLSTQWSPVHLKKK